MKKLLALLLISGLCALGCGDTQSPTPKKDAASTPPKGGFPTPPPPARVDGGVSKDKEATPGKDTGSTKDKDTGAAKDKADAKEKKDK